MSKRDNYIYGGLLSFLLLCLCITEDSIAQLPVIKTTITKNNILIGEQFQYKVESSMPDDSYRLTWFSIPDSFGHFVIVSKNKIDSTVGGGKILFSQEFTLTSFDSGRNTIPSLELIAEPLNADSSYTLLTDTFPVNVSFSPLDSVKTFHDIKGIIEVKKEMPWWVWLLIGLGVLIIIFLIVFLIRVFRKKEKVTEIFDAKLTPYDEAMKSLKDLESENLLQRGEVKDFHTRLTEIFKRYITRKTNIYKLHLTSDEILMELSAYGLEKDKLSPFANCLRMSNAVKFAKYVPPINESEECLRQTRDVIKEINNRLNMKTENAG